MNHAHLQAFAAFAEHLNFTHAAAALHLTQPALHAQVRKLGDAVGRPLYRREGRALALTDAGRRLAAHAREAAARDADALARIRGEHARGVWLAAGPGAYRYMLGPALAAFAAGPHALQALVLGGPAAIAAVQEARADLAVAVVDGSPEDVVVTPWRRVGQHVVMPRGHRLARRRRLAPPDLAGEALLLTPAGSPHRRMLAALLADVPHAVAVEAAGWDVQLQLAALGLGLAIVNDVCAPPRGTVAVPLPAAPAVTYAIVRRPGTPSAAAAAMLALL